MNTQNASHYFLGSNSYAGFHSLYSGFTSPASGDFLYVIKGGPGGGKSTFMRRLGDAMHTCGYEVEYVHCSADPNSLDGVKFPQLHIAYVDGTAPHVGVPQTHN
jgi:hypothetical protein